MITLSENSQVIANWEEYASIKQWKKGLTYNSTRQKLAPKTEQAIRNYMPLFLEYAQKTPDGLIEEALAGKHVVKERLSDFFNWMQEEKGKSFYTSLHSSFRIIRGFYSHNDINTQKIRTPKPDPSEVQFSDDAVPLFDVVDVFENNLTIKKKQLKREFLNDFFDCLSRRDRLIAMCLKDSGLDSGDLLGLQLFTIRFQEQYSDRIFIKFTRQKTKEIVCTFLSKETTKLVKNYATLNRKNALDSEVIFAESKAEFQKRFSKEHGRKFDSEKDVMNLQQIDPHSLSRNFRNATIKLEKILESKNRPYHILRHSKQSPLRPKRFRKLFNDACDTAGVPTDIKRVFMGKSDPSNKTYEGKSRQDLEIYYEQVEPYISLSDDQITLQENKNEKIESLQKQMELQGAMLREQQKFIDEWKKEKTSNT